MHCQHCKTNEDLLKNSSKNGKIYWMCRKCNTERHIRYRKTKNGQEKTRQSIYRSIRKYPERQNARAKVAYAIKTGSLKKENCFCGKKAEAHHEDYSKPLEVIWLCRSHHADKHKD